MPKGGPVSRLKLGKGVREIPMDHSSQTDARLRHKLADIRKEITAFRMFLMSKKFTGTESEEILCSVCCETFKEQKDKGWINVKDVDRLLAGIQSLAEED
jgi:hypothetical protein